MATRIVHCADLHLSASEADYSLSVLEEILERCRSLGSRLLLFAGDVFDTFSDLELLRGEFRKRIACLPAECEVIMIPGNHEQLGRGTRTLANVDLGRITLIADPPYSLVEAAGIEILAVPFAVSYANYLEWEIPAKRRRVRIGVAHGPVAGMHFAGPDEEEERQGVLDPDLFRRMGVDFAALGHIHAASNERIGGVLLSYPGSARVWRSGERGPRGFNLIEVGSELVVTWHPLERAGQYREIELPLDLDGRLPDLTSSAAPWGSADWVRVTLTGVIEDERGLAEACRKTEQHYSALVRRFEFDREAVVPLAGIAAQPVARGFLDLWKAREPQGAGEEREVWLKAREIGLLKIKELLEGQS